MLSCIGWMRPGNRKYFWKPTSSWAVEIYKNVFLEVISWEEMFGNDGSLSPKSVVHVNMSLQPNNWSLLLIECSLNVCVDEGINAMLS